MSKIIRDGNDFVEAFKSSDYDGTYHVVVNLNREHVYKYDVMNNDAGFRGRQWEVTSSFAPGMSRGTQYASLVASMRDALTATRRALEVSRQISALIASSSR